jgi:hypothetical protein
MAWIARALLLAGLLLTGCTMQTPLEPAQADQKIAAAMDWLKQNSDYHDAAPLPAWVEQSAEQMKAHATQSSLSPDDRNPYAIYDCPQHTLYLWSGANLKDSIVVSFILHALTHHLQCVQATPIEACTAEREAATLQAKFIRGIPAMFVNAGYEPDDALLTSVEGAARRIELNSMMACPPPPAAK